MHPPACTTRFSVFGRGPTLKTIAVQIIDLKPVHREGGLLALLSLTVGAFKFHEARLIQEPGGRLWVSPAQRSWEDPETGERRYRTLYEFPREWRSKINQAAAAALERKETGGGHE
jgi:hypothetical protein